MLGVCVVVIIACLIKIQRLNNIVRARVVPSTRSNFSCDALCVRVIEPTILNEFISFHVAQGFLTFTFYGGGDYENIKHVYGNYGLDLKFKPMIDNVEWDCLLDSVFVPEVSNIVILNSNEFVFPLESKYDSIGNVETCQTLGKFNFVASDDDKMITFNTKRETNTEFNRMKAIIPIGKTAY